MSWESSAEYYRLVNQLVRDRLGACIRAHCLLRSMDFAEIEQLQTEEWWDELDGFLPDAARELETAGAELLVLCTNTIHKVADAIEAAVSIPFLHLADATAVRDAGLTTVGPLGTAFTMEKEGRVRLCGGCGGPGKSRLY